MNYFDNWDLDKLILLQRRLITKLNRQAKSMEYHQDKLVDCRNYYEELEKEIRQIQSKIDDLNEKSK